MLKDFGTRYIQGVPILSVNIFRRDRGPIGEHCLLWAFFDFKIIIFFVIS